MHYFIISIIISVIVIGQFSSFFNNKKKLLLFKNIFPDSQKKFQLIQDNPLFEIRTEHKNEILNTIISSLNNYLINNKDAISDYHLIRDIVDRNCDAKEEEIHTQIPVPLYMGLAGTMLGILIGIGFLVITGGLNQLLNSGNGSGTEGIETLLGSVALAMISSITGITLTTVGSHMTKNAKIDIEEGKNTFFSWVQAELLPNMSRDTSSALVQLTKNLLKFNNTFAQNTQELRGTLSHVNDSYQKQTELMQTISRLRITDIATANIEVYDKLKNSTNEIGVFAQYLQNANKYLSTIQSLYQKLDGYEKRTQVIENAGKFFTKNEKWLSEHFDIANLEVKAALQRFSENSKENLAKVQESLNGQILSYDKVMSLQQEKLRETLKITTEIITESITNTQQSFEKAISDQQKALQSKLQETTELVEELKNLTHIKEGIKDFKEATNKQTIRIDELAREIHALALIKAEGGTIRQEISLPKWVKIFTISGISLFSVTCLIYITPIMIRLFTKLVKWLF